MTVDPWDALIAVGSAGFVACLMPQLVKTLRTRHADDLSWGFLVLVLFSSACTLPYEMHKGEFVFGATQAVNLLVWGTVAIVKLRPAPARKAH